MGLDMYLRGTKIKYTEWKRDSSGELSEVNVVMVDGYKQVGVELALGKWRQHAPLHHLIVNSFADGVDDCRPINLNPKDLRYIARCLRDRDFPPLKDCGGFYFGQEEWWQECCENADADADVFEAAASWVIDGDDMCKFYHSVAYEASW